MSGDTEVRVVRPDGTIKRWTGDDAKAIADMLDYAVARDDHPPMLFGIGAPTVSKPLRKVTEAEGLFRHHVGEDAPWINDGTACFPIDEYFMPMEADRSHGQAVSYRIRIEVEAKVVPE